MGASAGRGARARQHGAEGTDRQRWSVRAHPPLPSRGFRCAASPRATARAGEGRRKEEEGDRGTSIERDGNGGRRMEKRSGGSEGYKLCVFVGDNNSEALWASWHMVIRILGESEFEAL